MCLLLYFSLASYSLSVPAQRLPIHLIAIRSFFFHPLPRKLNGCVSTLFLCMYSASWLSRGNLCKNSRVCIRNCIQIMLFLHCVVVIATRSMLVRANLRFLFKLGILITKKTSTPKQKCNLFFLLIASYHHQRIQNNLVSCIFLKMIFFNLLLKRPYFCSLSYLGKI